MYICIHAYQGLVMDCERDYTPGKYLAVRTTMEGNVDRVVLCLLCSSTYWGIDNI